jgi:hypothetical protein
MLHFMTEHVVRTARLPTMWLVCALIILLTVGFVLPCMLDITMTPDSEFTTFSKGTWLLIAGAFWVFGATAWLVAGRPQRLALFRLSSPYPAGGYSPADAQLRHPAAQAAAGYTELSGGVGFTATAMPLGPDDDPDFLMELDRRIREDREGSLSPRRPAGTARPAGTTGPASTAGLGRACSDHDCRPPNCQLCTSMSA